MLSFTNEVYYGSEVKMICSYGDGLFVNKLVTWEKREQGMSSDDSWQIILESRGHDTPTHLQMVDWATTEHEGKSFLTEQSLYLSNVSDAHEGEYRCSVNVSQVKHVSSHQSLEVKGENEIDVF